MLLAKVCALGALGLGLTGCAVPIVNLNGVADTGLALADPTAYVKDGTQYTYGTEIKGYGIKIPVAADGQVSEALTQVPDWATGAYGGYFAAPDVVQIGGQYLMYFTSTKKDSPALNRNNCIGVAVSSGDMKRFVPDSGSLLCGEVWDPDIEIVAGEVVMLYSTIENGQFVIKSIRLTANGRGTSGAATTLLSSSNTIENATAVFEASTNQWVLLYSAGDWLTIGYTTRMAYCSAGLNAGCGAQDAQRGSIPFQSHPPLNMYGTGGLDVFKTANGSLRAVFHFWKAGDSSSRKTGTADVAVATQEV